MFLFCIAICQIRLFLPCSPQNFRPLGTPRRRAAAVHEVRFQRPGGVNIGDKNDLYIMGKPWFNKVFWYGLISIYNTGRWMYLKSVEWRALLAWSWNLWWALDYDTRYIPETRGWHGSCQPLPNFRDYPCFRTSQQGSNQALLCKQTWQWKKHL